jgi:hypothetical protein
MKKFWAQGDVLFERVEDVAEVSGEAVARDPDGAVVVARGEVTGHRHAFYGSPHVAMFRDDGLAREMPKETYLGHVKIGSGGADLLHEEHGPVSLPEGTYRVRQQRRFMLDPGSDADGKIERAID